jgi:hypothetical protein
MGLALIVALVVLLGAGALLRKGDPEMLGALFAQMSVGAADAVGLLH